MGARPQWVLLSLALRERYAWAKVDALASGLGQSATAIDVGVIGGNVTRKSGPLVVA
jgi:thiamine monophosphate kinase